MPNVPELARQRSWSPARRLARYLLALLLPAAMLAACSSNSSAGLPQAAGLLQTSSQAMADVSSTAFALEVSGNAAGLPISAAQGTIARGGIAEGSLDLGGTTYPFRLVGGTFYLQNPDNTWVSSPPSYDPSTLLDPTKGFASLLAGARNGRTQAQESVGGLAAYRVGATVPNDIIKELSDLAPGQSTLSATLWIATDGGRLLKFRIPFQAPDTSGPTIVTVNLKDFNRPVNVTVPRLK